MTSLYTFGRKNLFRISSSLSGLATGSFVAKGLPEPHIAFYQGFTVRVAQGLGGEGRHGYITAFIQWEEMVRHQAAFIQGLVAAAEVTAGVGNATLYLTLPRTDAISAGTAWIDISGKVKMPQWVTEPWTQGFIYQPVTLSFNNVTVENEPSTVL